MNEKNEFAYEIVERLGTIETYPSGWSKEVNVVSWNGGPPKVDLRDWDENHERMSRGITLSETEADRLRSILNQRAGRARGNEDKREDRGRTR